MSAIKRVIKMMVIFSLAAVLFAACASEPVKPDSSAADAAYADAIGAMESGEGLPNPDELARKAGAKDTPAGDAFADSPAPVAAPSGGKEPSSPSEPLWVKKPEAVFSPAQYVAVSGYGADRAAAEKNALANLANRFGLTIQADQTVADTYRQRESTGEVLSSSSDTAVTSSVTTSSILDTLQGTRIAEYWFDGKSTHYAAAVMDKAQARKLYADDIKANLRVIEGLTASGAGTRNTLDSYARYRQAAILADRNMLSASVLKYIGNDGTGVDLASLKGGGDYRVEAADIAKNIPIAVEVAGDKDNRAASAFTRALAGLSFRSGDRKTARYVLAAAISYEQIDFPDQKNVFVRYNLQSVLKDTKENTELFPFSDNGREGHVSRPLAENRALITIEKNIAAKFPQAMEAWLSSIVPMKK